MVLLVGDLIAPSGKGSSVSSESEGRDFSHANDGHRVEVRILALQRVCGVAEKALRWYGCEERSGAVISLKQARESCGGVEGKLRSTMPILSSTCEDLKTTCRDDRIYVPGPKIHVRRQRNRCSASGEVLAVLRRKAVLLRAFSSAPLEDSLV